MAEVRYINDKVRQVFRWCILPVIVIAGSLYLAPGDLINSVRSGNKIWMGVSWLWWRSVKLILNCHLWKMYMLVWALLTMMKWMHWRSKSRFFMHIPAARVLPCRSGQEMKLSHSDLAKESCLNKTVLNCVRPAALTLETCQNECLYKLLN